MRFLIAVLFFSISIVGLHAQCDDPIDVLSPGDLCNSAPILCELDGYCFQTQLTQNETAPFQFCGTPHNIQWVAFVAGSSDLTIEMYVSNCVNDVGLQAHVYESPNCIQFYPVSNCIYLVEELETAVIECEDLIIGQTYFMLIDGGYGDICDYQLTITQGETLGGQPVVQAIPEYFVCPDEIVTLDGTGSSTEPGFRYEWTTDDGEILSGETTLFPQVFGEGTYVLTVFNQVGCFESTPVRIFHLPAPIANADPELVINCNSPTIELGGDNISEGSLFTYSWSTSDGNFVGASNLPHPVIDRGGTYLVEITQNISGCQAFDTVTIVEDLVAPVVTSTGGGTIDCITPTMVVDGSGSTGLHNITFEWTTVGGSLSIPNGQYTPTLTVDQGGIYYLNVVDTENGCISIDTVTIIQDTDVPDADIELAAILDCNTPEITFVDNGSTTGNTIQYQWTTQDGNIVGPTDILLATISSGGTYTLEISDAANGCSESYDFPIDEYRVRPEAIINVDRHIGCEVNTGLLNAAETTFTSDIEYTWSTSNGNIVDIEQDLLATVSSPGNYTLIANDPLSGCSDTTTVEVFEYLEGPTSVVLDIKDPTCYYSFDSRILLEDVTGGIPPYTFQLGSEDTGYLIYTQHIPPGTYPIEIKDAYGCKFNTTVTINQPERVEVFIGQDTFIELGDDLGLRLGTNLALPEIDSVEWLPKEFMDCQNCINQLARPNISTQIVAHVLDENGCITSDTMQVIVEKKRYVFIPNVFSPNEDDRNDIWMINGGKGITEIHQLLVMDRWGTVAFEANNFQPNDPAFAWDGRMNSRKMPHGVYAYLIKIEFEDGLIETYTGDLTLIR